MEEKLGNALSSKTPMMTSPGTVFGYCDGLENCFLKGWVWNPAEVERSHAIVITFGRAAIRTLANLFRPDLAEAGLGTGRYGFYVSVPAEIWARGRVEIAIAVEGGNEFFRREFDFSSVPPFMGHVDTVSEDCVAGWVWSPREPDRALEIEVLVAGEVVRRGVADQMREDLLNANVGTGKYGFWIPMSFRELVGSTVAVGVRVVGSDANLPPGMRQLELGAQLMGTAKLVSPRVVQGWLQDRRRPDLRHEVYLEVDGERVGSTWTRPELGLQEEGKGNPFELLLPPRLLARKQITLRVKEMQTGYVLSPGAIGVRFDNREPRFGACEALRQQAVRGWAIDLSKPDGQVELEVLIDGRPIGAIRTKDPRPDIARQFGGNGRTGFQYDLPEAFYDGHAHELLIRCANGAPLRNSPVTLTPEALAKDLVAQIAVLAEDMEAVSKQNGRT